MKSYADRGSAKAEGLGPPDNTLRDLYIFISYEFFFFFGGGRGHACGFLFNFSKVTENAVTTIKLLIFLHICSDVAIDIAINSPSPLN